MELYDRAIFVFAYHANHRLTCTHRSIKNAENKEKTIARNALYYQWHIYFSVFQLEYLSIFISSNMSSQLANDSQSDTINVHMHVHLYNVNDSITEL